LLFVLSLFSLLWLAIYSLGWLRVEKVNTLFWIPFLYIAFIILRPIYSITSFFRTFMIEGYWIWSKPFSCLLRWSCDFFSFIFFMCSITFMDFCMLNHSYILEWNQLDYSIWSSLSILCYGWRRTADSSLKILWNSSSALLFFIGSLLLLQSHCHL
jgi:hypothetical protein